VAGRIKVSKKSQCPLKPATFQLVAQCLNQMRHRVPPPIEKPIAGCTESALENVLIFIAFHTYRVLYTRSLRRSSRCSTIRLSITATSTPMESKVTGKNIQSVIRFSHLTPPGKCPPAKELRLPFVQQGDETCALKKHVMGQYSRPELITQEAALSYRMPRAHRTLDWAFAIYLRNKCSSRQSSASKPLCAWNLESCHRSLKVPTSGCHACLANF
jgi:hypothetical protein